MGMPVTVEIIRPNSGSAIEKVFDYFGWVDQKYSPYKKDSELSRINDGLPVSEWTAEMKTVLQLCEETKRQTNGYFDINHNGKLDPSGLVKGWAINGAAELLSRLGFQDFYIEAGGDIQANGYNAEREPWAVGIRNPFNIQEIIKIVNISNRGVATSGTYIRGEHVYNPHNQHQDTGFVKSLTVIGPDIYEADRFATAAFAMGSEGIKFIETLSEFEAYMVDDRQIATYTTGFDDYVVNDN